MSKKKDRKRMEQMVRDNADPPTGPPCGVHGDWYCTRTVLHPGPCALRLLRPQKGTGRYYGGWGTIHGTDKLDVDVNEYGSVVAVWFRCQMLPFTQCPSRPGETYTMPDVGIIGVELEDR